MNELKKDKVIKLLKEQEKLLNIEIYFKAMKNHYNITKYNNRI